MVIVHQGVAQVVVLIGQLEGGLVKDDALLHAVPLGEGAGGDVAHDDFQGDDGHLLHQGLPVVELFDQMGGDALLLQPGHEQVAHLVVDDALARDGTLFQAVEGGSVVLIGDDQLLGVVSGVDLLGLALVEQFLFFHGSSPPFL